MYQNLIRTALAALLLCSCSVATGDGDSADNRLTGPFTHENLTVYFIHGDQTTGDELFFDLAEALEKDFLVVHETGNVGELAIENLCDYPVFIQAGDIVKGGRQDRVLAYDLIVYPGDGMTPIPSYCVEQGRWSKRGGESDAEFSGSKNRLASRKALKIAAFEDKSQSSVWAEVSEMQDALSYSVAEPVASDQSTTSLQLALENEEVQNKIDDYLEALNEAKPEDEDIIGMVFAINGEINSADIYRSAALFDKQWPRLAEACAIEALAEPDEESVSAPAASEIAAWLDQVESSDFTEEEINEKTHIRICGDESNVGFESYEAGKKDTWVHRNYIKK